MDYDLIAISESEGTLWFCEITTSGYFGGSKGPFHVGASRKICESHAKFAILRDNEAQARKVLTDRTGNSRLKNYRLECGFVVPKGSLFITALGWRTQLITGAVMRQEPIELPQDIQQCMEEVLGDASKEQQQLTAAVNSGTLSFDVSDSIIE
jgi:hypothetical protein